jgi:hypothetical protein
MTGITNRLMQNVGSSPNTNCNMTPYNDIKIEHIIVAFVILACGAVTAVAVFVVELIFSCVSLRKKSSNSMKPRKNRKTNRLITTLKSEVSEN